MEDICCKICRNRTEFFSEAEILNKYKIKYFICGNCGFVQTEKPYWFEEAYSEAINYSDIGILKRNLDLINPTKNVINFFTIRREILLITAEVTVFS
jgi:protein-arginine kinase activator protein McsA